ncbi:MAG: hypothetical protein ACYSYT_07770 [Planctomycetota bacterium]|jgi:hypothetical protein
MKHFLVQTVLLANGEGEDTFWMQMLVLVVLGALLGIGSLIKTRTKRFKNGREYYPQGAGPGSGRLWQSKAFIKRLGEKRHDILSKAAQLKGASAGQGILDFIGSGRDRQDKQKAGTAGKREKDLTGGMELLEPDFLVGILDNTEGHDEKDVTMRKLAFDELLHRKHLGAVASVALKVYATNRGNLYDKDIQCEAMKELTERTARQLTESI